MFKAITLLLLGLLAVSTVGADEAAADRFDLKLKNERFQSLPAEVRRVHVGPDGRMWVNLDPSQYAPAQRTPDNIPAFRKRIAREFSEKSPQFYGADLALFEPGGRVWFFLPQHCVLLGYDGVNWIDYVIPNQRDKVIGSCPTRGAYYANRSNRYAQNAAWFVCMRGILRFDGQDWSYRRLTDKFVQNAGYVALAISPDEKTIAACQSTAPMPTGTPKYWLFEHGKWGERELSAEDVMNPGGKRTAMNLALSDAHSLWIAFSNGQLERIYLRNYDSQGDRKDLSDPIRRLADDNFSVRQRATKELLALGPSIKPQIEDALKQEDLDPEQDYRLKFIIQCFTPKPAMPGRPSFMRIGDLRVQFARQLFQDSQGNLGIVAQVLRDSQERQGPGVALVDKNNHATPVFMSGQTQFGHNFQNDSMPVADASGKKAWWPSNMTGDAVQLYDASLDMFIDTAPMPIFGHIMAVTQEGRLFLAKNVGGAFGGEPIVCYTPDAPETRTLLKMEKIPIMYPFFSFADDGSIWALQREENPVARPGGNWGGKIVRYDGKTWTPLDSQPSQMAFSFMPGKDGIMLVQSQMESILYRGEKEIASGDLVDMIEKNKEVFQKNFDSDMPNFQNFTGRPTTQIVADKAGNIWRLEEGGRLLVLVGDKWLLAHEPLVAAGSSSGMMFSIAPLGDRQKIYAWDRNETPTKPCAFLGEVKDGKLVFSESPRLTTQGNEFLRVRDAENALWGVWNTQDPKKGYQQLMVRLAPDGTSEKFDFNGNPKLVDEAGNVWVEKTFGPKGLTYKIWRKGEWIQEISVPGVSRSYAPISDKPGSVFVWTNQGLQHLVADGPDYKQFRVEQLYSIDNLSGDIQYLLYDKAHGYLGVLMQGGTNNMPHSIGLIKLPQ